MVRESVIAEAFAVISTCVLCCPDCQSSLTCPWFVARDALFGCSVGALLKASSALYGFCAFVCHLVAKAPTAIYNR